MQIKVKKLHKDAVIPTKAYPDDTGMDVTAIDDGVWSKDGLYIEYDTGLAIEPPPGYYIEIFPRSSISKTNLILANSIGLCDSSYRGPYKLRFKCPIGWNEQLSELDGYVTTGVKPKIYQKGDKIAQLVIRKRIDAEFIEVEELNETDRNTGGFGSSDKKQ